MAAEADVGILCHSSSLPGFRGVLKQRYTDFIVNEVDCDGKVIHLTSLEAPVEENQEVLESSSVTNEVANKESQINNVNISDHSKHIEAFESLAGKGDVEKLKDLLDHVSAGSIENISPIVLSPDPDKAHRTAVHNFFKTNLSFLVTDTIDGTDPKAKCVRVRYYPNKNGTHGRGKDCRRQGDNKRKNWGGKQDRNVKRGKYDGSLSGNFGQAFDSRGADEWPEDRGKFLRFHLCKENKDTQEALIVIGKMLGVQARSFGFAGTKDKRAVTTQRVTVFKQKASRLAALNNRLYGIKVGDFCYVRDGLVLGQLSGNRFTITLRGVVAESHDIIREAAEGLGKNGFINYFGLQRSDIKEAREYYKSTKNIDGTLKQMPRYLVAERAILACLKKNPDNYLQAICAIPRTLRMMYVHSYQSYLWNHAASARVQKYGVEKVVEGDLVYCKETEVDKQNPNKEDKTEVSDGDTGYEFDVIDDATESDLSQESVNVATIANADDIALGKYTIDDVVLPLPGSRIIYPANDIAETFHNLAGKDSVNLRESSHNVKEYSIMSVTGGYRRLIQKPLDYMWNIIKYVDPTQPLVETDLDALAKCSNGDNIIPQKPSNEILNVHEKSSILEREQKPQNNVAGGYAEDKLKTDAKEVNSDSSSESTSHTALQISFTLPTSCYATMAIRELLKTSTS
ncbi:hypothetical protein KI387_033427, partial [Taxus chinensis]